MADKSLQVAEPSGVETVEGPMLIDPAILAQYDGFLASVPVAEGDGFDNILAQIAAATEARDLDKPWATDKLAIYAGVPITVTELRRLPSDYAGGLAWYLVVTAAIRATGELVTITTGSVAVVAQLVKAYSLGKLPLTVIPRRSERPSRNGFYPWHLEIVG